MGGSVSVRLNARRHRNIFIQKPFFWITRCERGLTFYASSRYPENWIETSGIDFKNSGDVFNYLVQYYKNWDPIFFTLFKACKHFVPRSLNYFPIDQHWEAKSNLTRIGNAAHLMPPSGEGVNTAMLDALDLSECLTSGAFQDLQTAIAAYETQMWVRASLILLRLRRNR